MDFSPDEGQQAVTDVVTSALGRDNSSDVLVAGGVVAVRRPGTPRRRRSRSGGDHVRTHRDRAGTAPSVPRWRPWGSGWCHYWTSPPMNSRTASWPRWPRAVCCPRP